MRSVIVALLSSVFAFEASADLVAKSGDNELRLMEAACRSEAVLATIKDEWREKFKAAHADIRGKVYAACWIDTGEGIYFVAFDDGDTQVFPVTIFTSAGL